MPVLSGALDKVSDVLALVRSLLNDTQVLQREIETPANSGVVRSGNVVTVKTKTPHDYVIGSSPTFKNVPNTSFNGTHEVATVPSTTTFTFSQVGVDATSGNGTVEAEVAQVFTDTKLMPLVRSAYRWLQKKLAENGIRSVVGQEQVVLSAYDSATDTGTKFSDGATNSDAFLPADFLWPWELWERAKGSTEEFVMMAMRSPLPQRTTRTQSLDYWEFRGSDIITPGATRANEVRMRYEKTLPRLTSAADELRIKDAVDCLAFRTCAMVARARGVRLLAGDMNADALAEVRSLVNRAIRPQQRVPVRRLPYSLGLRSRNV